MSELPQITTDEIVAEILKNFMLGIGFGADESAIYFERAVYALRLMADSARSISKEQRHHLDAAIQAAQPHIVHGESAASLRVTVGALHVVTAELARNQRASLAEAPAVLLEALSLARILENHLNSSAIFTLLQRKRAVMDATELSAIATVVNTFYPHPATQNEPPAVNVSVH